MNDCDFQNKIPYECMNKSTMPITPIYGSQNH
jgi:hypothetical protein